MPNSIVDLLRRTNVFAALSDEQLRKLANVLKERRFDADTVIFSQGDAADALYIIVDGQVKVTAIDASGRERVLTFSSAGDVLGEMGLVTREPRSATVVAMTRLRLLQLAQDDFDAVTATDVAVLRGLLQVITSRREATDQRAQEESGATIGKTRGRLTVVFSPRGGAGTSTIASNLAVALAQASPDRVALLDLDVTFGKAALLLNLSPRTAVSATSCSALENMDRETFEFYLTTHAESSLRVLVGTLRPEDAEMVTGQHVRAVLELLRKYFAHVIVDTRRSFSDVNLTAIEAADEILMVCTPDRVAVRGIKECQRILAGLLHLAPGRFELVLNHVLPYRLLPTHEMEELLGTRITHEIPFGNDAPTRAALEGYPLVTRWSTNPASKAITAIAETVHGRAREAANGRAIPPLAASRGPSVH